LVKIILEHSEIRDSYLRSLGQLLKSL